MHVLIRETANGSEYWNTKEKKTIFVPDGSKPGFEVTENPESMLFDSKVLGEWVGPSFEDMTVPQLKQYADVNNIDLPADVKKKEDIVNI